MTDEHKATTLAKRIEQLEQTVARQKKIILSLENKANSFDSLKNNTSDPIHSVTADGHFLFVNQAWQNTLGYSDEDLQTLTLMDIIHPECLGNCETIFNDLHTGQKIDRNNTVFLAKDGRKISVEGRCNTRFVNGKAVAMTGIFRDLSEHQINAKALIESEERYRDLFENTTDLIQILDPNGYILYVNKAWRETFSYSDEEIAELSIFELISPDCQNQCEQVFQEIITIPKINYINTVFTAKDGRKISIEGNAICKFVDGKPIRTQCIFRDVTQKNKMEEELHKAQKIESLGVLAGGIAHDFNNLLTAILGNISLAKMHTNSPERVINYLENTERASQRAKGLTQQLLTFSKGGAPIKRTTTIGDLITDSTTFVLRGSNVNCIYDIAENLWPVDVDEGQLSQVTQNLAINASQAMTNGGSITIRARNKILNDGIIPSLPPGGYIEVQFEDKGCGIKEEHLSKIFDPYFTSKQSGSGLGLAISYSIIKNHDGLILVQSEVDIGTIFTIYLPACSKSTSQLSLSKDAPLHSPIRGHVLVMDDEKIVRDISVEILECLGCQTAVAANGHEAITLYMQAKENNTPFDVLIMDLTIPGSLGGLETLERLRILDSEVKALVSSGYANNPVMANYREYGFCGVVPKPFMVEELNKALSIILPPLNS
ncbi:MAG: PAS domain S-box protein [Proteobacteria bacterium]|nr:PAS domain S-box protein [Pseudomonadota bacterium]MBU1058309.1 PAS domain S-box protein [Pseudomonadota bacterium]